MYHVSLHYYIIVLQSNTFSSPPFDMWSNNSFWKMHFRIVVLCFLFPFCGAGSQTLEYLKHYFGDNEPNEYCGNHFPLALWSSLFWDRQKSQLQFFLLLATKQLKKSYSHILLRSVPVLRGDQVEGPEDLNLFSEQVSPNLGAHLQMASCCQPMTPGCFF